MPQNWIAIAGSADGNRATLGIQRPEGAVEAAKQIGRVLADEGFGIIVYSSDPQFVECHVVSGYVSSEKVTPESIRVIYPRQSAQPLFVEQQQKPTAFKFKLDQDANWEVSFYRSIYDSDGVVLIGGGQSTLVAGVLCAMKGTPLVSLEAYGGAASKVWEFLNPLEQRVTNEEKALMAEVNPSLGWAQKIIESISAQRQRLAEIAADRDKRQKTQTRDTLLQAVASLIALGLALAMFVVTWDADLNRRVLLSALILAPALAGGAASMLRTVWESLAGLTLSQPKPLAALLGSAAGAISGLLYVVAQLTALLPGSDGKLPAVAGRLVPFALLTGFLTGYAADAFFRKLREREVSTINLPTFKT